ncbi:MAG: hypothetical protein K0S86_4356 [Geminicoccaceae bacterium]|nr:hypothetical protein [Geminicoccaceae bacterium]
MRLPSRKLAAKPSANARSRPRFAVPRKSGTTSRPPNPPYSPPHCETARAYAGHVRPRRHSQPHADSVGDHPHRGGAGKEPVGVEIYAARARIGGHGIAAHDIPAIYQHGGGGELTTIVWYGVRRPVPLSPVGIDSEDCQRAANVRPRGLDVPAVGVVDKFDKNSVAHWKQVPAWKCELQETVVWRGFGRTAVEIST